MKITKAFKDWLVKEYGVEANATEDEFKKAAAAALLEGKLTAEKHVELVKDPDEEKADEFVKRFDRVADGLEKAIEAMLTKEDQVTTIEGESKEDTEEKIVVKKKVPPKEKAQPTKLAKMITAIGGFSEESNDPIDARVKSVVEEYSTTKTAMTYPEKTKRGTPHMLKGERVKLWNDPMDKASDLDLALAGVWAKYQLLCATPRLAGNPQFAFAKLTDHEKGLLCHLTENCEWDRSEDEKPRRSKGFEINGEKGIKALIDDATSGGLEAAPIVFDDRVIETPLLYGELYPLVTEIPLSRGRRIEGVSTGTVTGSWGGVDDSAIALFTTTSYVAAFNTTIYRWEGSVRIGLDFLSDTPIDFGASMTRQYGERLLEDLDDVIATGNGTTQPEGITNKSGTTAVAFGGTTTLGNYESLRFGVPKNEHGPSVKNSAVFIGTETSYSRAHGIPVGTADARRLGGMDYDSYMWMQRPYKINESLTNQQVAYAIMARYRMYRRKGFAVRTSTEGDTLIRNNEMLIVAMARYGGQLERGAVAAVTTTAPA